ncbi:MAG TPA: hypothetical protein VK595_12325 [Vicinamibacterales bacterium]|nr:hypothetical protein [Vicinamibacterales bacterium]
MKPAAPGRPTRADDTDENVPVTPEEIAVIRERLKTFDQDAAAARPASETIERLLRRPPAS